MILYHEGSLHLKDTILWMDAVQHQELSFVSHPYGKQMVSHEKIIATRQTIELYKKFVLKGRSIGALQMPFFRNFSIGNLTLSLFPSGHTPGSAQLMVKKSGHRILYSGHFNVHPNLLCDEIHFPSTDTLIIDTTYGDPRFIFPPRKKEEENLVQYVSQRNQLGEHLLILAESYGKAQYIMMLLRELDIPIYLQNRVYEYTQVLKQLGYPLPTAKRFRSNLSKPSIIIYPLKQYNRFIDLSGEVKVIGLSGEAAVDQEIFEKNYQLDKSFILSDHSDFKGIIEYIRLVNPEKVYLLPGRTEQLIKQLKKLKIESKELAKPLQRSLF